MHLRQRLCLAPLPLGHSAQVQEKGRRALLQCLFVHPHPVHVGGDEATYGVEDVP
eukprot:CAMPEP_0172002052 /NCGR_PEP_ID=MMETSP1041-20130122/3203_1 /TAXON_ID=464988 /ORGANISM="Hemiselmis andersenii, Strain CCMP439" /LENGTH=54 /DNA_ID=CAMNT_0012655745 /DNA_START=146 /DNA_END=310 /DNA_ORIENTATION=-